MIRHLIIILLLIDMTSCAESPTQQDDGPTLVLSADREAPVGWVNFDAYADKTFTYSLSRETKYTGTYTLKGDTLFLSCADNTIGIDMAIIREKSVEFFGKKSPRFATLSVNKITK